VSEGISGEQIGGNPTRPRHCDSPEARSQNASLWVSYITPQGRGRTFYWILFTLNL